jgi:hypothetical protein
MFRFDAEAQKQWFLYDCTTSFGVPVLPLEETITAGSSGSITQPSRPGEQESISTIARMFKGVALAATFTPKAHRALSLVNKSATALSGHLGLIGHATAPIRKIAVNNVKYSADGFNAIPTLSPLHAPISIKRSAAKFAAACNRA